MLAVAVALAVGSGAACAGALTEATTAGVVAEKVQGTTSTPFLWVRPVVEMACAVPLAFSPFALILFRYKSEAQGFSRGTLRFGGLITVVPLLLILSLERVLEGSELGTLIGTLIGYLLAGLADKPEKSDGRKLKTSDSRKPKTQDKPEQQNTQDKPESQ